MSSSPQQVTVHDETHHVENSSKNVANEQRFKEKEAKVEVENKKKEPSFFTKVVKYLVYIGFIVVGLFIGKVIIDRMNETAPAEKPATVNINTVSNSETNKPKSELKIMRDDKNKYY